MNLKVGLLVAKSGWAYLSLVYASEYPRFINTKFLVLMSYLLCTMFTSPFIN